MNETNHPARRLRHGERPTEPLVFEDAAAIKAAEEGGPSNETLLKMVCRNSGLRVSLDNNQLDGYLAFAREAIAADRASRQVANKADVEPTLWVQYIDGEKTQNVARDAKEKAMVESIHRTMAPGTKMEWQSLYATPPATTGASTAEIYTVPVSTMLREIRGIAGSTRRPVGQRVDDILALVTTYESKLPVGASTVLTDERTAALTEARNAVSEMRNHLEAFGQYGEEIARVALDGAVDTIDELIGEVAAQAGQVAVPGWISVDEKLPPSDLLPNGDCPSVIALWKDGALAENLVQQTVTNTAYLRKNPQNFTHWMHLPPSPAKESK